MKCHYEVLEVERDASDDDIKKAYRKLALKWHPDKNPDNIDECTKYFALIQQAYDVLSDNHERAWYDRHREDILRGGLGEHYKDDSLNLFPYFTSTCYSGFGDDDKGFYTVYRGVFETLSHEDLDYIEKPEEGMFPSFGKSDSSYEEIVGRFYGFWQSYATAKSYAWLDKYDTREAPNRQVARAMEKENKKLRDAGRKARNEEVRELVAYVRKRDKRLAAYRKVLEERRAEQEVRAAENRKQQIRDRLKQMEVYQEASYENTEERELHLREIESALAAEFGDGSDDDSKSGDDEEEEEDEPLYCIACEKAFKTPKAMENHEKSKKHKEIVAELKKHMQAEDAALLDGSDVDDDTAAVDNPPTGGGGKKSKRQKRNQRKKADEAEDAEDDSVKESTANDDDDSLQSSDQPPSDSTDQTHEQSHTNGVVGASDSTAKQKHTPVAADQKSGNCETCGEVFDSRSKLFKHLTDSGHAKLKYAPAAASGKSSSKKSKSKKK
uniref:DnaJ homolog subfamily C member 21 n=1 Tax=Plectus sambesii TaxID=2011161 RepID=A0A914X7T1_9BILA